MTTPSSRLQKLLDTIDDCNRHDPHQEEHEGLTYPKELLYSQRMSAALAEFLPEAGEELQIAARAQHIERWRIPRSDYPMNRAGYLKWRRELGKFHAQRTLSLMAELGYEASVMERVQKLLTKQNLKQDPLTQALEDVICLVFIRYYLADFAASRLSNSSFSEESDAAKLDNIIRKTWAKMSARGQQFALTLPLDPVLVSTLKNALADQK